MIKIHRSALHKSNRIDMIISAGLFWNFQYIDRFLLDPNNPILQKIKLEWIVAGKFSISLYSTQ